jgi:hypothetical protein
MKKDELLEAFENGEDVLHFFDTEKAYRPALQKKRVALTLTQGMLSKVDAEAARRGVPRNDVITSYISTQLPV